MSYLPPVICRRTHVLFTSRDEGTESADIATNENILLLDEYSKVKLF